MRMKFDGCTFSLVCPIEPRRTSDGSVQEFMPQGRYKNAATARLNKYGGGPFCKFAIPTGFMCSGVYALMSGPEVKYIGECQDLTARYNMGYGNISPRNCYIGGQETNCRLNNLILAEVKGGGALTLWFHQTSEYKALEKRLRSTLRPAWNRI
jgi:hypothetical protein